MPHGAGSPSPPMELARVPRCVSATPVLPGSLSSSDVAGLAWPRSRAPGTSLFRCKPSKGQAL
ncbi:hypothetical protein B0T26DRAFT_728341 [Lasiosphaeria miniovina]|uniref:Uncharacterized protein n=1 Tax=Lasiosphaeria miniovina TaxID=1954250 RepID=A0AA40A077_9PEZI|nr:uncharacterized protein B0T26DRAFT_728341 [Lasiosphaeria miniovina]KAK0706855.1 hypothetical protein B0T26DRAFT_728341 [Lasiosphaeria miniovina]